MYHFIVNPNARSGLGHKMWNELENILKTQKISYEVFFTKYQRHATSIANKITSDGEEHTIVALGGDGTVNEVVNGIVDYEKTILGYIPIGSSNDFARGLNLPTDPQEALQLILSMEHLHPMNVGVLEYKNRKRYYAVSAGLGFDAAICHEVVVSKIKYLLNKLKLGKLTYVAIALHRLSVQKPDEVVITLDNEKELRFPATYFVALMNNRYEGGGFMFTPDAKNDDDMIDIMVASNIPKLKVLRILPTAYKGNHTRFKGIHIFRAKHIQIESKQPLALHTDGEPIFLQRKISTYCADKKIRIITRGKN